MKTVFATSLSRTECARRLRAAIAFEFSLPSNEGVKGLVWGNRFGISKRLGWFARRMFPARLRGRFEEIRGGGTRITCTSGTYVFPILFMAAWFSFGLYILAAMDGPWLLSRLDPRVSGDTQFTPFPLVLLVAGGLAVFFDRAIGSGERAFLIAFLARVLEAKPSAAASNE